MAAASRRNVFSSKLWLRRPAAGRGRGVPPRRLLIQNIGGTPMPRPAAGRGSHG
ncbi:hypothetical protein ACFQ5Q_08540 [Luteolibacter ambystomatis]